MSYRENALIIKTSCLAEGIYEMWLKTDKMAGEAVGSAYKNAEGVNVISASGILNDGTDNIRVISADMTLDRITIIVNSFIDMDKAEGLSAEECAGLVKALQLRNELTDMELQSVYFRGCYDGVGYLKKAGIL